MIHINIYIYVYIYVFCILLCVYILYIFGFFSLIQSLSVSGLSEGRFTYAHRLFSVIMWQLWFYFYPFPQPSLNGQTSALGTTGPLPLCYGSYLLPGAFFWIPSVSHTSFNFSGRLCGLLPSFQRHQRQIYQMGENASFSFYVTATNRHVS